jgi:hypothetical protein
MGCDVSYRIRKYTVAQAPQALTGDTGDTEINLAVRRDPRALCERILFSDSDEAAAQVLNVVEQASVVWAGFDAA